MFFSLSKILWFVVSPQNLFFLLLVLSVILLWTPWKRMGKTLASWLVVAGMLIAVVPIGSWVLWHLENRFPVMSTLPDKIDGIIIAGGIIDPGTSAARGQLVIGDAVERITAASELAILFPDAKVVFSGGSGDLFRQDHKEADYVAPLFEQLGVSTERVIFENQARNTVENAEITLNMMAPRDDETWVLVTSAFHMPRAMGTFRKAGWSIQAFPTDFSTYPQHEWRFGFRFFHGLGKLNAAVHEILGLIFYRLTGRSDAFFPAPLKS
jgi:uncharacterized SAM-binding protein YcdF (DUF218 family)